MRRRGPELLGRPSRQTVRADPARQRPVIGGGRRPRRLPVPVADRPSHQAPGRQDPGAVPSDRNTRPTGRNPRQATPGSAQ